MGLIVIDNLRRHRPVHRATAPVPLRQPRPRRQHRCTRTDFLRVVRFIRLWRKLGLSIELTDDLIAALYPRADRQPAPCAADLADLDAGFLIMLPRAGFAFQALTSLGLDAAASLPALLACWAPIGTAGPDSLYARMFLTPTLLRRTRPSPGRHGNILQDATRCCSTTSPRCARRSTSPAPSSP